MHKDTRECVAVKMVNVDDSGEGLTQDNLKKEVPGGSRRGLGGGFPLKAISILRCSC